MRWQLGLIGTLIGAGAVGTAEATEGQPGVIEPRADAELHRMSNYLAGLNSFRVDTSTVDETNVNREGQKIQVLANSTIAVRRPSEMRIDRISPNGRVVFRYDGRQFSVYNSHRNIFATAPAPAHLDQATDAARTQLRVDAPGVDLVASNPYGALTEGVTAGRYIGLEPMGGGVMAHHLNVTKRGVAYQIWIQDGPQPVPLRYVVMGRNMRGSPQFTIELHNWQPNAEVPNDTFAFVPPAGAQRVPFAQPQEGCEGRVC